MTTNHGGPIAFVVAAFFVVIDYFDRWQDILQDRISLYVDVMTAISITIAVIMGIMKLWGMIRGVDGRGKGTADTPITPEV